MSPISHHAPNRGVTLLRPSHPLRNLRRFGILEGATLVGLILVAVPLKRLAGWDAGVAITGPIHGFAFLVYVYLVFEARGARELTIWLVGRSLIAALIPFGTWINDRELLRQSERLRNAATEE